jgi:hypothetical protein
MFDAMLTSKRTIRELREEAAEARALAATFPKGSAQTDLKRYAAELDREADALAAESQSPSHRPAA